MFCGEVLLLAAFRVVRVQIDTITIRWNLIMVDLATSFTITRGPFTHMDK